MSLIDRINGMLGKPKEAPAIQLTMADRGYVSQPATPKPGYASIMRDDSVRNIAVAPKGIALDRSCPQEAFADKILASRNNNWQVSNVDCSKIRNVDDWAYRSSLAASNFLADTPKNAAAARFADRVQERAATPDKGIDPSLKERFAQGAERSAARRSEVAAQQQAEASRSAPRIK